MTTSLPTWLHLPYGNLLVVGHPKVGDALYRRGFRAGEVFFITNGTVSAAAEQICFCLVAIIVVVNVVLFRRRRCCRRWRGAALHSSLYCSRRFFPTKFTCASTCVSSCFHFYLYPSLYLSPSLTVCVSICPSVCLSVCLSPCSTFPCVLLGYPCGILSRVTRLWLSIPVRF